MIFNGIIPIGQVGGSLTITATPGAVVTINLEGQSKTKTVGEDGRAIFKGLKSGTWNVVVVCGDEREETTIEVVTEFYKEIRFLQPFSYTYTGESVFSGDPDGDWTLQLLTNGELTVTDPGRCDGIIDLYLLGGGGGGSSNTPSGYANNQFYYGGGGGGGGYSTNVLDGSVQLKTNDIMQVTVGAGGRVDNNGGETKVIINDITLSALGGKCTTNENGGDGGSGGGAGGGYSDAGCAGGKEGNNGGSWSNGTYGLNTKGGKGQGRTTQPFGDAKIDSDDYYGRGGGGGGSYYPTTDIHGSPGATSGSVANRGGGGLGCTSNGSSATAGSSGIVIIRNRRIQKDISSSKITEVVNSEPEVE